jgi:hypothetical protein
MKVLGLAALAVIVCFSQHAHAAEFTSIMQADFLFEIVDGPISDATGIPVGTEIDFRANGPITFEFDDSDPVATTLPFTNATGVLPGVSPTEFLPYNISPNVNFVGGELTNIVRVGGDIVSAQVSDLRMEWELTGTPLGVRLYGDQSRDFN